MAAGQLLAPLGVSPAGVRPRVAVSLGSGRVGRQDSRCAVPGAFLSRLLLLLRGETTANKTHECLRCEEPRDHLYLEACSCATECRTC